MQACMVDLEFQSLVLLADLDVSACWYFSCHCSLQAVEAQLFSVSRLTGYIHQACSECCIQTSGWISVSMSCL